LKHLFIINGIYKSGLQLVAGSLAAGGAVVTEWGESKIRVQQLAGQSFDGSQIKEIIEKHCFAVVDQPSFILSHKNPSSLQELSIKTQFIEYYSSIMQQLKSGEQSSVIVNTANFKDSISHCIHSLNAKLEKKIDAKSAIAFYEKEKYTHQKTIDKYRDVELNAIHAYFS